MYQQKIDIVVCSKYPEVGKQFAESFIKTTKNFENIRLHIVSKNHPRIDSNKVIYRDTDLFGGRAVAPILQELLTTDMQYFGWFNDDMWMVDGWLEDVFDKFNEGYLSVCAGVVDTDDHDHFLKVVEQTKDAIGVDDYVSLVPWICSVAIFRKMGQIDERFIAMEDFDLLWRLKLNNIRSCSSKKITMAHWIGTSSIRDIQSMKSFKKRFLEAKDLFIKKHGYEGYHYLSKYMNQSYKNYFAKFRYIKNET